MLPRIRSIAVVAVAVADVADVVVVVGVGAVVASCHSSSLRWGHYRRPKPTRVDADSEFPIRSYSSGSS